MDEIKGFEKIDLESTNSTGKNSNNTMVKNKKHISSQTKRKIGIVVGIIIAVILLAVFTVVLPSQKAFADAKIAQNDIKQLSLALKQQDINLASSKIAVSKKSLATLQTDLQHLAYFQFIPLVSWYYSDAKHLAQAGVYGLDAGNIAIDAVKPYADVLGLKGAKSSFVKGTAEQRIQTAVLTLEKITPHMDDLMKSLILLQKEMGYVDPNHYPGFIAKGEIREQLTQVKTLVISGVNFATEAKSLVKMLPNLLGDSQEKKYLILFQNDKEIRPTGGFLTAYAIFSIDKGIIHKDIADDMYKLDNTILAKPQAPEVLQKYLKVNSFNLRDTNISPDFVESIKLFNSLYDKSSSKVAVDGIIALDTHVLASTIKILDNEVWASGIEFTSDIDKRCDCPQVVYQLERMTDQPKSLDLRVTKLEDEQAHRKDIIGVLLYYIMEKSLKSSPKKYWGPLMQNFIKESQEKHILFNLTNADAQRGMEALSIAGRIKSFTGDYLHINHANLGGAKSNLFVKNTVTQNITASGGTISKTVTINYKNPFPASDCNLERGGLCLNGTLHDWVRVYVPKGSRLMDSKGSEEKIKTSEDLGKTVFEGFVTVNPQGIASLTLTYQLPSNMIKNGVLPLFIQKQPGTDQDEYTITVNNHEVEKFPLLTDKEVQVKL